MPWFFGGRGDSVLCPSMASTSLLPGGGSTCTIPGVEEVLRVEEALGRKAAPPLETPGLELCPDAEHEGQE